MAQDDDVEKLFSWLQTPDIRYREFAGSREVTDAVVTYQEQTNRPRLDPPAPGNVQLDEEYPQDQFPDQSQVVVEVEPPATGSPSAPAEHHPVATGEPIASPEAVQRGPAMIAPMPTPAPRQNEATPFALSAAGRANTQPRPPISTAAPSPTAPTPPPPPPPPSPQTAPVGGARLLGGAYRDDGRRATVAPPAKAEGQPASPLASVFNRLSGGTPSARNPQDRMSHIPGVGPTTGRSR
jgi:hypothetical protein